ncbi:MAG: CAP domain-containing protein [SAR324 cluster bacterium]|nr:CAP domain-containing protein [SAR324 cluster bacterium]
MKAALCFLASLFLGTTAFAVSPQNLALEEINQARLMAGLNPLKLQGELTKAAQAHADYIKVNNSMSHLQERGKKGFTGVRTKDRVIAEGYHNRFVHEMFFVGSEDIKGATESLFSAIYHRLGFLDFSSNELGYGERQTAEGGSNVFVMGNRELNEICQRTDLKVKSRYYFDICKGSRKTPANLVDRAKTKLQKRNPTYVLWPPEGSRFVPPGFFDEVPDPVPDKLVTGYPLSVQFNPYYFKNPSLVSFRLFNAGGKEIKETRILTKKSDPNKQLTPLEFALFPLNRLDWGASYQAELVAKEGGKNYRIRWGFYTKKAPQPVKEIQGKGERFTLVKGQTYYLYIPPTEVRPIIQQLSWSQPKDVTIELDFYDKNTLKINLKGEACKVVHINLPPFRGFQVQIVESIDARPCK